MQPPTVMKTIPAVIAGMILIVSGSAFALSFYNLAAMAGDAGIPYPLAYLWPICLDCFLIIASLYILWATLLNESARPGWAALILFTGVSTAFNILHAPDNLVYQAAHAVPPIALCVSLEFLMMVLRNKTRSEEEVSVPISIPVSAPPEELSVVSDTPPLVPNNKARVETYFLTNPKASTNQAAKDLGLSWATVKGYRDQIPELEGYQ